MSQFLFTLSNIAIPLLLLVYKTAVRVRKDGENGCGQWFCLILTIFLSNILYYMASDSKIYLFGDLLIKLGICFLPASVNASLQKNISYLHLEILFEFIRSFLIEKFFVFYSFFTTLALSKMDEIESTQFKQAMIAQLNKQNSEKQLETGGSPSKLSMVYKHYENIGVNCEIMTPAMLQKSIMDRERLKRAISGDKKLPKPTGNLQKTTQRANSPQFNPIENIESDSLMKKKNSILIQRSSTDLGIQEPQEIPRVTTSNFKPKPKQQQQQTNKRRQVKNQQPKKKTSKITVKQPQIQFQAQEPSMILNKLDVSEYSDMFEQDQEFGSQSRVLVTKVEAIVEIGAGGSTRLEIYNIQLFSNDQIRIMSLYGREFEKHKLVQIHQQKHGYYELILEGGKINKRRVKFRGKIDSFVKYLKST